MIAVIQYNAGNVTSVVNALNRLGFESIVTHDEDEVRNADKVIFPGVGEAAYAMQQLKQTGLEKVIPTLTQPVLGICLGMQLMCNHSQEGNTKGLGIFDAEVKRFPPKLQVPHMGWNDLLNTKSDLFKHCKAGDDYYFVHSYYAEISQHTIAECDYILSFSAAMQSHNFYGTQFHPEKSGSVGEQLLKNFLSL